MQPFVWGLLPCKAVRVQQTRKLGDKARAFRSKEFVLDATLVKFGCVLSRGQGLCSDNLVPFVPPLAA